ncbi:MAG: ABC transporter ATP-binding protein [Tetragenococcus halophilus]|nr:ABC transporter ATP-binding protein [Tetragenococcus halophilus]
MRNIVKQFGDFKANDNVNLKVRKGEVHALLGENGAGKSTIMNVLTGLLEPTEGEILINGEKVVIDSPDKSDELGIGMVHQHFMLIDKFTVAENIMLGNEEHKMGLIDSKTTAEAVKELSDRYGLYVDPYSIIRDISVGQQQRVEILKALYGGADILILDEPTAVLTPQEIDELMKVIQALAEEGKAIIIITHKLAEIKAAADRCTVIRRGKGIGTVDVKETSEQELADMMVGREVNFSVDKEPAQPKEVTLSVKDLVVKDTRGLKAVDHLSFDVREGEIVGIAGVDGNGQSELIQAITGLTKVDSGTIKLKGKDLANKKPRSITESGLAHIPEDRQRQGLVLEMSLEDNMALQTYYKEPLSKNGVIKHDEITKYALRLVDEFDVRMQSEKNPVGSLSGGNQQKAIIAREVDRNPDLLIAAQPTRGLDVGAIEFIHKRLIEQRDKGKAVILMSFELDEIMDVSDRIAVMHDGVIIDIVDADKTDETELGLLMAGVSREKIDADKKAREELEV